MKRSKKTFVMISLLLSSFILLADAEIKFKEKEIDFGEIESGETIDIRYEFENIGDKPLIIKNVSASCGCTSTKLEKREYQPGEKGEEQSAEAEDPQEDRCAGIHLSHRLPGASVPHRRSATVRPAAHRRNSETDSEKSSRVCISSGWAVASFSPGRRIEDEGNFLSRAHYLSAMDSNYSP